MKLLTDISAARGHPVPDLTTTTAREARSEPVELEYPFNLLLSTATIPAALAHHLDAHHPRMTRLASPDLHHLPAKLQTEYVAWSGGNQNADIEQEIRKVWRKDVQVLMREAAAARRAGVPEPEGE